LSSNTAQQYNHQNCIDFINYCHYFQQLCANNESENFSNVGLGTKIKMNTSHNSTTIRRPRRHNVERKPRQAYNTRQLERLETEFQVSQSD